LWLYNTNPKLSMANQGKPTQKIEKF